MNLTTKAYLCGVFEVIGFRLLLLENITLYRLLGVAFIIYFFILYMEQGEKEREMVKHLNDANGIIISVISTVKQIKDKVDDDDLEAAKGIIMDTFFNDDDEKEITDDESDDNTKKPNSKITLDAWKNN